MLEMIKKSSLNPLSTLEKGVSLQDIPPELIYFALQQMALFYRKCDRLSLPASNPIAFLDAIRLRLGVDDQRSSMMQNTENYLPLMLLYSAYGNSLFCAEERPAFEMVRIISSLRQCANSGELRAKVQEYHLEPAIRQQAHYTFMRKIFAIGEEFNYWEEQNEKFAVIQEYLRKISPLNVTGTFFCPRERAIPLIELFVDYYISHEKIVPDTSEEKRIRNLRERLIFAVEMRELHSDYMRIGSDADKAALQTYTEKLLDLLEQYPVGLAISAQLKQLWKHYQERDNEIHFDNIHIERLNQSKSSSMVRNAALILLLTDSYPGRLEPLREQLEALLQCYMQEPLYCFFTEIFKMLELYPDIQPFAPVYVWRLFVQYSNRISKVKNSLFHGADPVDFSWKPVFSDLEFRMLSEENTSRGQYQTKCDLFEKLVKFFEEESVPYPIDKPMCEYLFQRLTQTELNTYSDTSIFGTPLHNKKPLYRGFALVRETLSHAADNLWMDMPRKANFPVSAEDAAKFYQDNYKSGIKAMQYLFERKGGKPEKRRKVLGERDYNEIVRIALLSPELTEDERTQKLSDWMQHYISSDPVFREYASTAATAYGNLQFAIYRLALDRFTHYLVRDVFDKCTEMFYYPLPSDVTVSIWKNYFTVHHKTNLLKQETDSIHIRSLKLNTRNLYALNAGKTDRWMKRIQQLSQYPYTLIVPGNVHLNLQPILTASRQAIFLFEPDTRFMEALDNEADFLDRIAESIRIGYDGIKAHGLRIDSIIDDILPFAYLAHIDLANHGKIVDYVHNHSICTNILHLAKKIRNQIGQDCPFIFTIHIPSNIDHITLLILRILCRWLSNSGVDAVELTPVEMAPAQYMANIADQLSADIPLPVLVSRDLLLHYPKDFLQKYAVTGFITYHPIRE